MALVYVIYTFLPVYVYQLNHDGAMKNIILDAALNSNYKILQTDRHSHEQGDLNLFLYCATNILNEVPTILIHTYIYTLSEIYL